MHYAKTQCSALVIKIQSEKTLKRHQLLMSFQGLLDWILKMRGNKCLLFCICNLTRYIFDFHTTDIILKFINSEKVIRFKENNPLKSQIFAFIQNTKLYIPNTLNIDLILWHTQLIVCRKCWIMGFPFTFQAYILPHTLNCMCVSLLDFIFEF